MSMERGCQKIVKYLSLSRNKFEFEIFNLKTPFKSPICGADETTPVSFPFRRGFFQVSPVQLTLCFESTSLI